MNANYTLTFSSSPNGLRFNGGVPGQAGLTRELITLNDCARQCDSLTACLGFYYRTDISYCVLLNVLDNGVATNLASVSYSKVLM